MTGNQELEKRKAAGLCINSSAQSSRRLWKSVRVGNPSCVVPFVIAMPGKVQSVRRQELCVTREMRPMYLAITEFKGPL